LVRTKALCFRAFYRNINLLYKKYIV
jgi:hypothetical protein